MTLHHLIFMAGRLTAFWFLTGGLVRVFPLASVSAARAPSAIPRTSPAGSSVTYRQRSPRNMKRTGASRWRENFRSCSGRTMVPAQRCRRIAEPIERFAFPASLVQRLRVLSQQAGGFCVHDLLAGFVAVLKRYTEQDEIVIGSLTAGRNRVELEQNEGPLW